MNLGFVVHVLNRLGMTAAALSLPLATSVALLGTVRRRAGLQLSNELMVASALPFGLALSAATYLLWLALPNASPPQLVLLDLFALLLALRLLSRSRPSAPYPVAHRSPARGGRRLALPVGIVALGAAYVFTAVALARPHGDWDAWAMWNSRARFFALAPERWLDAFKVDAFFHPDYPFLLPAAVARLWTYGSAVRFLEPIVVAALFATATAAVLYFALRDLRDRTLATLAILLLLGSVSLHYGFDSFPHLAATQMADVPVGCYFLLSVVLLAGAARRERTGAHLALAGVSLSLAAWTKNEGAAFAAIVLIGFALTSWLDRSRRGIRETLALAAGAAPGVVALLLYKTYLVPPVDLFKGSTAELLEKLASAERHLMVGKVLFEHLLRAGGGAYGVLTVAIVLLGVRRGTRWRTDWLPLIACAGLVVIEYLVLVMSPHDPVWHARSSIPRLLSQLWPSALFAAFLIGRSPGAPQASNSESSHRSKRVP